MRITLVVSSLACGGSERTVSNLANSWAARGRGVTVLTFDDGAEPPFYDLHPAVTWRPLGIPGISGSSLRGPRRAQRTIRRLRVLHRAIGESQPDAVLAFVDRTNVLTLLASVGLDLPVVISERVSPQDWPIGSLGWKIARRLLYPRAARLVVQTQRALSDYPSTIRRRAVVIPNPAIPRNGTGETTGHDHPNGGQRVIGMGRLTPQKGFDLLLDAFARVAAQHPTWSLVVWGEGPERAALEAQRDRLGLEDRVHFPGLTNEPAKEMAHADLFVLSSRFEGFPNALCEAMAAGLPVVSFDCRDGPRDLVRHGVDGILVPPEDFGVLATALDRLMANTDERARLAVRAPEVLERFSRDRVIGLWDDIVKQAVSGFPGAGTSR